VKGSRGLERYYGHHRPIDWFNALPFDIIDADTEKTAQEKFDNLIVVRVEIPLLYKNEPIEVLRAINKEDSKKVEIIAKERLRIENKLDLSFVPAPVHITRGEQMKTEIGSIRIAVHDKYVNKGTGLKYLAELLNIPEQNIVCFGDSAGNKANDAIIKKVLPKATLIITSDGERTAKEFADFLTEPVERNGVPKAIDKLIEFQERYSEVKTGC
jgi:hydroxymethylpyrimidine pyrophosphatase-like HAD family hydrolase